MENRSDRVGVEKVTDLLSYWSHRTPHAPVFDDELTELDFRGLLTAVEAVAARLRALEVRAGDRLAILGENSVAVPVLMLASQVVGAWPAVVNPRLPHGEIDRMLQRIEPRRLVFTCGLSEAARHHGLSRGAASWQDWPLPEAVMIGDLADTLPEPVPHEASEQIGLLIFTSGTTGMPKAVMHSHRNLLKLGEVLAGTRRTRAGDHYSGATPISHIMGVSNLMCTLWAGAGLRLLPRLDVPALIESIRRGEMTHLSFVPTAYQRLLEYVEQQRQSMDGHRLSYISCGGATLDPTLKARIEALFGLPLVNGYGMTECAPIARTRQDSRGPAGSIGWPETAEIAIRLIDNAGRDVPEGSVGEMLVASPTVMKGYYRDDAATRAAFAQPGWLATGDLARRLPDGQIEIVGRRKEMIIRSGFNVYPAEVEQALNSLPGIAQSAVVGRPAEHGNEEVVAFVELRPEHEQTPEYIREAVAGLIAPYKLPVEIRILPALPLGGTGKIKKVELRRLAMEPADRPLPPAH